MKILLSIIIVFTFFLVGFPQGGKNYGMFAPADAYLPGDSLPYYGSENEWSRRMFSKRAADRFYKRRGQRQLLAILEGQPEKAIQWCQQRLKDNPDDSEVLFMMVIAYVQTGRLGQAFRTMQKAVAAGLPFERFLAGPRKLLKPLTDLPEFKKYAEVQNIRILHGPMLGAVTESQAQFWVRTVEEAPVQVLVYKKGKLVAQSAIYSPRFDRDYTTVLRVTGLDPRTEYTYNVRVNEQLEFDDKLPYFKTYPKKGTAYHFKIGFGGGAGYTPQNERMWETIRQQKPDAFLFLGDNVYLDLPQKPGAFHQYTYYRRQSRPEFRRLIQSVPIYAIWDDHDAAIDDVWLGPYRDKPAWKMPLLDFFRQNWNNPYYGNVNWPGCWFDFSIGDVDFFMLDGRTYRTNPFDSEKTMLGAVQKQWLFQKLKASTATFKVIVSPVPWVFDAKPNSRDTWNGYREEREEIFNFLSQNQIGGVVLLSADRHRSDAWKIERAGDYPLYEFESSKLTNLHTHEIEPGALFGYNQKDSFGLLEFNTAQNIPEVTYRIVTIDGEVVYQITLKRNQLK